MPSRPRAGHHPGRWFDATYVAWRRRQRPVIMLASVPLLAVCAVFGLIWPERVEFFAGVAVGCVIALYTWAIDSPPEWIERKRRGRDAERRTERALRPLEREGWAAVHGLEARWGDFDHVAVGPGGVYLIETKCFSGEVTFDDSSMMVRRGEDERDAWSPGTDIERRVRGGAAELKRTLAPAGVRWVHPVVVLWTRFPDGVKHVNGVTYVHGRQVAAWLRGQPLRTAPSTLAAARTVLDERAQAIAPARATLI